MNAKAARQIEEMKKQTIGVEVEMNNITRDKAAKIAADLFGTHRYQNTEARNGYCTWSAWDSDGREWKFQKDVSISGCDSEKCEMVTPILHYSDIETLQELVRTSLTSVQRMEVTNSRIGDGDVLSTVLLSDADKIRHTLDGIDRENFNTAVEKIISAKTIYIMGMRSSASLAGFLNYNLRMIFDNIKFVDTTSVSEMFEQIMGMSADDVLVAISFPRYSKRIINAVDYAKHVGADVIAITDSSMSPIARNASQLLIAKSDMASFVDSLVAPLSIINAIIVAVARKKQDELTVRLRRLEEIWDEYDVYDKAHS